MSKRRAIVTVTNDLSTDRRVDRTCRALMDCGYEVLLIGRSLRGQLAIDRPYRTHRMRLLFTRGPLFYAEYNTRLFFKLLSSPFDLLISNDLDTLPACYMAHRMKKGGLIYDSHEFFTEVPELSGRFARKVWLFIEKEIFPHLDKSITVNDSIADAYDTLYGKRPEVIRNMSPKNLPEQVKSRKELGIQEDSTVLILQGSGINLDRGGEEAVLAMSELPECHFLIIGGGDAWPELKRLIAAHSLQERVTMIDRLPYKELMQYTLNADLGLSLDKDTNLNYRYSLPNKLFDYLYAAKPVLASDLPEVEAVLRKYDAGLFVQEVTPDAIVRSVQAYMSDTDLREKLVQNAKFAARDLDPDAEYQRLVELIKSV